MLPQLSHSRPFLLPNSSSGCGVPPARFHNQICHISKRYTHQVGAVKEVLMKVEGMRNVFDSIRFE